MNFLEMNQEVLECARYGEEDDLKQLLEAGADANFADAGGATALHKAAANGHEACIKVLVQFGAKYVKNGTGNTPAHWAAENAKAGALKAILESFELDVLQKNDLGRSILTEAFQSKDRDCISLCLSHHSCTEERLINPDKPMQPADPNAEAADAKMDTEEDDNAEDAEANAITHTMVFGDSAEVKVRELPITRADNPFGSDTAPEDDTTGLSVWPASILLGQWVARRWGANNSGVDMSQKVVLELGAGCGLPAIVAAVACRPQVVYVTDIHEPTLLNAAHNVQLNAVSVAEDLPANYFQSSLLTHPATNTTTAIKVLNMNWVDTATYPPERVDLLLGSDLVYDASILTVLVPAICSTLSVDGSFLYCAPNTGRHGMDGLEIALSRVGIVAVEKFAAPEEFYVNPLSGDDGDAFVLHFYDLSAKTPHTMYHFKWQQAQKSQEKQDSTAMET